MRQWDFTNLKLCTMFASNTAKAMNNTLKNAAVVDATGGLVTIALDAHGFAAKSYVRILGTANYDGIHQLVSVATNTFNIKADFVAETPTGSETIFPSLGEGCPGIGAENGFLLMDIRLTLSDVGDTAENFTVTEDAELGAFFDNQFVEFNTDGLKSYSSLMGGNGFREYGVGDFVDFKWPNGGTARNWGLKVIYAVK